MNIIPTKRADYIAKTNGTRNFPWRVIVISKSDKELLNIDIVQKLASPPRITDISWIQPGQVAWDAITQQMDKVFPLYFKMGVKGFKIDFIDRDDQLAVASTYEIAKKAAEYHLLVDYHGVFKPTGLQRTYPNVIGYEGVKGLENVKWAIEDAPRYAVSIPFIRMMAGPMDYTPGAMRNVIRANFRPLNSAPMSQGARCQQLAMYVVYEAVVFKDGINADREATDYKREVIKISSGDKLNIQLSKGGGWAARIEKSNQLVEKEEKKAF